MISNETVAAIALAVGAGLGVVGSDLAHDMRDSNRTKKCASTSPPGNTGYVTQYNGKPACIYIRDGSFTWTVMDGDIE